MPPVHRYVSAFSSRSKICTGSGSSACPIKTIFAFVCVIALFKNTAMATVLYSEDFSGFDGSGFVSSPTAGQLDSGHYRVTGLSNGDGVFGANYTTDDFARGSSAGGVSTGGIYAFDVSNGAPISDTALGIQPSGSDATPGDISLRLFNDSTDGIHSLSIQFDIFELNNANRASSLNFGYAIGDESNYNPLLFFTGIKSADTTPMWVGSGQSVMLSSLNWLPNDALFLRWSLDDFSGSGSRDEWAIDNIHVAEAVVVPEPGVISIFVLGLLLVPVLRAYSIKPLADAMRPVRI